MSYPNYQVLATRPGAITPADIEQVYQSLSQFSLSQVVLADEAYQGAFENIGRVFQRFCFTDPGITDPHYTDPAELTAAQLAPVRWFREWATAHLAATDWQQADEVKRAWIFWENLMDTWTFSESGLPQLLIEPNLPLVAVLDKLLDGPNLQLAPGITLGNLVRTVLSLQLLRERDKTPWLQLVPRMLRFEQTDNSMLANLAHHPDAAHEVPRFLNDFFTDSRLYEQYKYYAEGFMDQPATVKLLKTMLPNLREYLVQWRPEVLRAFCQLWRLPELAAGEGRSVDLLETYAKSPNRQQLLRLLTEVVTEPELHQQLQEGLQQMLICQEKLAEKLAAKRKLKPAAKPRKLADFNLKLLVVRELLLMGEPLPELETVLARSRNADDYSYEPVKSVVAAYRKLQLSQEQLDKVESLEPDAGDIWDLNIINNWDGEDDQFTIQSLKGIELLRNLRIFNPISLVEVDDFSPLLGCPLLQEARIIDFVDADSEIIRELEERGIRVE